VFRGVFEHQIDSKGRTSFPVKLRESLLAHGDDRMIVTTSLDACLHCYPLKEWELLERALSKRNPMEPGVKSLLRLYVASAQEIQADKLGRILLPENLRTHAKLSKDLIWAGMVKIIEIWSKKGWKEAQENARQTSDSQDVMRVLSELKQEE
jgi:MraZ protein